MIQGSEPQKRRQLGAKRLSAFWRVLTTCSGLSFSSSERLTTAATGGLKDSCAVTGSSASIATLGGSSVRKNASSSAHNDPEHTSGRGFFKVQIHLLKGLVSYAKDGLVTAATCGLKMAWAFKGSPALIFTCGKVEVQEAAAAECRRLSLCKKGQSSSR